MTERPRGRSAHVQSGREKSRANVLLRSPSTEPTRTHQPGVLPHWLLQRKKVLLSFPFLPHPAPPLAGLLPSVTAASKASIPVMLDAT